MGQNLEFREVTDVTVARAVAEMRILAKYCLPLVRFGGLFVAAKGRSHKSQESNYFDGCFLFTNMPCEFTSTYGQTTAIICLKDGPTPKKYPCDQWNSRTQISMWFDNTEEEASLLRDYVQDQLFEGKSSCVKLRPSSCHLFQISKIKFDNSENTQVVLV